MKKVRRLFTLPWSGGAAGVVEPEEVARRHHLAELEKIEIYSLKMGRNE